MQFHPTAIDIGADPAPLATESLRGEGALIVDRDGHRFLAEIDPAAELAARDIVARGVFDSIAKGNGAFLDARAAVGAEFSKKFPTVYASCMAAGIDPAITPIPIAPAAHYHMGGVATDARGRTSLSCLWAAGEVACTGLHGANRLASNSLLEALVFGARVAADIAAPSPPIFKYSVVVHPFKMRTAGEPYQPPPDVARDADESAIIEELRDTMAAHVGVARDAAGLSRALATITRLRERASDPRTQNMLTAALLIAAPAFARRESRGAHFRSDFPNASPEASRSRLTLAEAETMAREATS